MPVPSLLKFTVRAQAGTEPSGIRKCTLASTSWPCKNSVNKAADSGSGSDHESTDGDREEDLDEVDELEELRGGPVDEAAAGLPKASAGAAGVAASQSLFNTGLAGSENRHTAKASRRLGDKVAHETSPDKVDSSKSSESTKPQTADFLTAIAA